MGANSMIFLEAVAAFCEENPHEFTKCWARRLDTGDGLRVLEADDEDEEKKVMVEFLGRRKGRFFLTINSNMDYAMN